MTTYLKKIILWSVTAVLLLSSYNLNALTVDESNKTVVQIGSQASTIGYVAFSDGVNKNCVWGGLYFDVSTPLGKSFLATLIVAKTTGQKVRVGYTAPSSVGVCNLELVILQ